MIDLTNLPGNPGCYLFSDAAGTVIYVGKAKNLKKRVTSYFQKTDQDPKTRNLISRIESVSVMVTNTETEALLLENNLIKKHQPKYNFDLKDAKRFAYIELTSESFPRIGIARRMSAGDATYFGPFVSASERDALFRVIKRIFCLRSCKKLPKRACLRYHMKSCSAPCIGLISGEDYNLQVERASALLKGKISELLAQLRMEMAACSAALDYERALVLRNQIAAIGHLAERQHVERPKETDQDVIAYTIADDTVYLMVFSVEKGLLLSKQEYSFDNREDFFEEFLVQYYAGRVPPAELILPHEVDEALAGYLSEQKGRSVQVTVPKIGAKKKLLDLVEKNIEHAFLKNELKGKDLQATLGLPDVPEQLRALHVASGLALRRCPFDTECDSLLWKGPGHRARSRMGGGTLPGSPVGRRAAGLLPQSTRSRPGYSRGRAALPGRRPTRNPPGLPRPFAESGILGPISSRPLPWG